MNRTRMASLGIDGMATAMLGLVAAALLAAAATGALDQGWAPMVAAATGIGAGLLGCLGMLRRADRPVSNAAPAPVVPPHDTMMDSIAALLRTMAEEMVRLKRDGAETSRSLADARQASARVVDVAASTIARLDESAESSAIAARALCVLPGIADTHAQRIELMAARAEQALALVPEAMDRAGAMVPQTLREEILAAVRQGLAQHQPGPATGLEEALSRRLNALAEAVSDNHVSGTEAQADRAKLDARLVTLSADLAAFGQRLPEQIGQQLKALLSGWAERLSQAAEPSSRSGDEMNDMASRFEGAAALIDGLCAALPEVVRSGITAAWAASVEQFEDRFNELIAELPQSLLAGCEARIASVADRLDSAAMVFPGAAERLHSHFAALETLCPVLDGVTERLIETADALAATGSSLPPIAHAASRAMDALALAANEAAARGRPATVARQRDVPEPGSLPAAPRPDGPGQSASVATSILGQLAEHEEPIMAETLTRLDGIGSQVAALLREAERLVDQSGGRRISGAVARRAPEVLENLNETIRGLQSISTAIAMASDRDLGDERAA